MRSSQCVPGGEGSRHQHRFLVPTTDLSSIERYRPDQLASSNCPALRPIGHSISWSQMLAIRSWLGGPRSMRSFKRLDSSRSPSLLSKRGPSAGPCICPRNRQPPRHAEEVLFRRSTVFWLCWFSGCAGSLAEYSAISCPGPI